MITKQINTTRNTIVSDVELLYRNVFVFVLDVIEFTEILKQNKKYSIATELLQTATIWGESFSDARSIKDLPVLNLKIEMALREADKIKYWLNLCKYSNCCPASVKLLSKLDGLTEQIKKSKYNSNK